jgi:ubiquinol-cytochrome c reductase cytochrome c1 subunit
MSARLHSFYSSAKRQFFSPNQNATHSAFGASNRAKTIFFTKTIIGSSLAGIAISEFILTEERIFNMAKAAEKMGLNLESIPFLGTAHAFSTAAHGLHPPHFPWEFEKFYKTFDHAA